MYYKYTWNAAIRRALCVGVSHSRTHTRTHREHINKCIYTAKTYKFRWRRENEKRKREAREEKDTFAKSELQFIVIHLFVVFFVSFFLCLYVYFSLSLFLSVAICSSCPVVPYRLAWFFLSFFRSLVLFCFSSCCFLKCCSLLLSVGSVFFAFYFEERYHV